MSSNIDDKKILKTAESVLSKYKICNPCLGRLFAKIVNRQTNKEYGELLRKHLKKREKN